MTDRILIDANSVAHAAHQGKVLKSGDQETQAVFGALKGIRQYRLRHPNASVVCLWDGRSWRKDVCDTYKANRTDNPEKRADRERFKTQMPYLRKSLAHLGVAQLFALNLEADDLAAILTKRYTDKGDFVRLISGDRDWLQLVGENCIWEDHRDDTRKVNAASFHEATGYPNVTQFVQSKALQGDTSDNLPGVGKIGEKGAAELLSIWGDVKAFLADPDPDASHKRLRDGKKLPKAFADFHANVDDRQAKFFRNMHMMNLLGDLPAPEKLTLKKGEFSPVAFKAICHELGFHSIVRNEPTFETFCDPFYRSSIKHGSRC